MTSNAAFKKQVRTLAARDGIPYSEARSRLLAADQPKGDGRDTPAAANAAGASRHRFAEIIGTALVDRAIEMATADRLSEEAEEAWAEKQEREGLRIVSSGMLGAPDADGRADWAVDDWRTGQTLASGRSTFGELPWEKDWINISQAPSLGVANFDETAVLDVPAVRTTPELERFISQLVVSMDYQDWPIEFGDLLQENGV